MVAVWLLLGAAAVGVGYAAARGLIWLQDHNDRSVTGTDDE